jgi:hypothetical protein
VGLGEAFSDHAGESVHVGDTQGQPHIARADHPFAGQGPHAEGETRVGARGAAPVVLGRGRLALDDLHAHVGVGQVGQASLLAGNEIGKCASEAVDQLEPGTLAHAGHGPENGSTSTSSPGATSLRSSSSTTKQLPATIEERIPDP